MEHKGTNLLKTERLILRKFKKNDCDYIFSNWASNENVAKYLTWNAHKTKDITKDILNNWIKNYNNLSFYQWCIALKENEIEPIGSISVVNIFEDCKIAEIGYCLCEKYWNKKIMTEALNKIIKYLLYDINFNEVQARHHFLNIASGNVMKNCNMKFKEELIEFDKNKNLTKYYLYNIKKLNSI